MKRSIGVLLTLMVSVGMLFAVPAFAQAAEHCPDDAQGNDAGPGAPPGAINGATGSTTIDGVTVSWDGTTVTVEGGSATLCIKGGISGTTGVITLAEGTYTTGELGLTGPQGQSQTVSYLIVYDTEPPVEEEPSGSLSAPDCENQTVTATVENPTDEQITAHVFINGSLVDSFDVAAGATTSGPPLAVADGDVVELFIGDSTEAEASITVDLDCDEPPPPGDEPSAALIQGDCETLPVLTLTNPTDEEVTFVVNGFDVVVAAETVQPVTLSGFGNVVVVVDGVTIFEGVAVAPQNCEGVPPQLPPPGQPPFGAPPAPPGLPVTL